MNHFDPDESPDRNNDIDAFEQQLRSLRPTPPTQSWDSAAESMEPPDDLPALVSSPVRAASWWRSVVSHSLTAAAGLAVGIGVMVASQPKLANQTNSVGTANDQPSAQGQGIDSTHQSLAGTTRTAPLAEDSGDSWKPMEPRWRTHRFSQANMNSGPLTAFGTIDRRLVRSDDWQQEQQTRDLNQSTEPDENGDWLDPSNETPVDQPVLSPGSLQLFLDELTCTSESGEIFCNAKDYQS